MLTGARQSTTGIIGQRSTPTQTTVAKVMARGPALAGLNCTSLAPRLRQFRIGMGKCRDGGQ